MRYGSLMLMSILAISCGSAADIADPVGQTVVDAVGVTAWNPSTVTIKAGEMVEFRNAAAVIHNVRFDQAVEGHPGDVANFESATKAVVFTTPGTFPFHCGIHPAMQGQVIVQP